MEPCNDCTIDNPRYCPYKRDRAYLEADRDEKPRRAVTARRQMNVDLCRWHQPIAASLMQQMIFDQWIEDHNPRKANPRSRSHN